MCTLEQSINLTSCALQLGPRYIKMQHTPTRSSYRAPAALLLAAVALLQAFSFVDAGTCFCNCCQGAGCDLNGLSAATRVADASYATCSPELCWAQYPDECPASPALGTTQAAYSTFPLWAIITIAICSLVAVGVVLLLLCWCCCYSVLECICCCCCPGRRRHRQQVVVLRKSADVNNAHMSTPGPGKGPYDVPAYPGMQAQAVGGTQAGGYSPQYTGYPPPQPVVLGGFPGSGSYPSSFPPAAQAGQASTSTVPQPAYYPRGSDAV